MDILDDVKKKAKGVAKTGTSVTGKFVKKGMKEGKRAADVGVGVGKKAGKKGLNLGKKAANKAKDLK